MSQFSAAIRAVRGHRALARLNRRLVRVYESCGCDVLALRARHVARIESARARDAMTAARVFRAIEMLEA